MLVGIEASAAVAGRRAGVGHYVANLAAALQRVSGDDVQFLYFSNRYDPATAHDGVALPAQAVYARDRLPSRTLWLQTALPRSLGRVRPDVCHFPNNLAPIQGSISRPFVVTMHDMSVYRYPACQPLKTVLVHRALLPRIARRDCIILADSASAREDILEYLHLPGDRVRVVHLGVDSRYSPTPEFEDRDVLAEYRLTFPYILAVGTVEPRKNQARLIEAFAALVRQERIPHHLVLAGGPGWKDRGIRAALRQSNLGGRIHALGYVAGAHLPALYRGAEAFAFPSLYEGFGLPALEALASGTPTLVSTDPALREVTGDAALSVDPRRAEDIAGGLLTLLRDGRLAGYLRAAGPARARHFTWERCARATLALYREVEAAPWAVSTPA
jgi:glycosyltransferase involved in cell wall biosynthesis